MSKSDSCLKTNLKERFRGFLPVVVDVETAGINPQKNALLEICIVLIDMDKHGNLYRAESFFEHVTPFQGAELNQESLDFNKIDPFQPLRFAVEEKIALKKVFAPIEKAVKKHHCQRAVLVGHNAWFDLLFVQEATKRTGIKSPFHSFTCFDTASLSGVFYGQTVLAKAAEAAGILFDQNEAHSAIYDAEKTADLFCTLCNQFRAMKLHVP